MPRPKRHNGVMMAAPDEVYDTIPITRRQSSERLARVVFGCCTALSTGILVYIIGVFAWQSYEFISSPMVESSALLPEGAFWMMLNGTLLTTVTALVVAMPLGLFIALYLTEFAPTTVRNYLKGALEVLSAVPPIIWAFFAVAGLASEVSHNKPSAILAGLVLGIMILPMTATLIEDAIFHVPKSLLESAVALGATRLQALLRVIIPTAAPGIVAAVLLSFSRAVSETIVLALAAGDTLRFSIDPFVAIETVTGFLLRSGTTAGSLQPAFVAGTLLFAITGALHILAGRLLRRGIR
ncbi:MAG: ABC transporter permease subunit [Myxococcota bacterium]|nr:ABC transporter permease subunit [Myxococcota bacterium]